MPYPVVITFALVLGVVLGAYWFFVAREESADQSALRRRMKGARAKGTAADPASLVITERPLSDIPALDKVLRAFSVITGPAGELINRAGVSMNVGTLLLTSSVAAMAMFLIIWHLSGTFVLAIPLGAIAGG